MYGIVNKAIHGLVTENFGDEAWQKIKEKSGIKIDNFLSNEPYDDSVTYSLAGAASEVLEMPLSDVLKAFGEYWILKTGMQNYGSLMEAGGDNLKEFLENLPNFHSRVMLMFPDLQPPEFRVSDVKEKDLKLHYYSHRQGLQDFVIGLVSGLGKMYNTEVDIKLIASRDDGADHETYHIKW